MVTWVVVASIALEDFASGSGVRGPVLEGLSGVVRACSDDYFIVGVIWVKKVLPSVRELLLLL